MATRSSKAPCGAWDVWGWCVCRECVGVWMISMHVGQGVPFDGDPGVVEPIGRLGPVS